MTDRASRARSAERRSMAAYEEQGASYGHNVKRIDVAEFRELAAYDAAFLRLDTSVFGLSFAASRYAWERGLRIVDDPKSLLTCMNKAHAQGLLEQAGIPTPETVLLTRDGMEELDPAELFAELGSPIIVKAPHGAFSSAVEKANDARQLRSLVTRFGRRSDVVLLQRYAPSTFDWRVGILCGQILYVAKYHIPKGAWRIHDVPQGEAKRTWAKTERVSVDEAPDQLVDTALRASQCIGRSLYGVDMKEDANGDFIVIEVNDNPNIDFGGELTTDSPRYGQIIDLIATQGPRRGS